jgi:hypothetical protein
MGPVESSRRCKPGYERVIVSAQETWSSTAFLDYYLRTRKYAVTPSNRALLRVVFRGYRGPRPITVDDLIGFMDRRLGFADSHPAVSQDAKDATSA